jgi:hypothetical protein
VFFSIACVLLALQSSSRASERIRHVRAFGIALALGAATEIIQIWLPAHDASLMDVLHDAAGAALALAVVGLWSVRRTHRSGSHGLPSTSMLVAIGLTALTVLAWEPLQCARVYAQRQAAYPTLAPAGASADAAFTAARNARLTRAPLPAAFRVPGDAPALELKFGAGSKPALELSEPYPDWHGHDRLAVDLTNPGDRPVQLILRILDARHDWHSQDRANLPVLVAARTRTTIRVSLEAVATAPAQRRMDLRHIANVMLFAPRSLEPGRLYVSSIRLE